MNARRRGLLPLALGVFFLASAGASRGRAEPPGALPARVEPAGASRGRGEPRDGLDDAAPPWVDPGDVPVPAWAHSVAPTKNDAALYVEPGKIESRRGSAQLGARLPLFATRRANGCQGRWLEVGPFAWMCSDVADYSADEPGAPTLGTKPWLLPGGGDGVRPSRPGARPLPPLEATSPSDDGLPYRYYFAGQGGAYGYASLARAQDDAPDQELEQGFAVAIVEEKTAHGESWGRTKKGRWFAMRELVAARPFAFHGVLVPSGSTELDVAWVTADKANLFATEKPTKAVGVIPRFERVSVKEERGSGADAMVRVEAVAAMSSTGGAAGSSSNASAAAGWMRARDVGRARVAPPPPELAAGAGGGEAAGERWIDVDLAQQTLVAYEGKQPVFATLVSTGKGPPKTEFATPPGTHRIWVKIFTTKMDNLEKEDVEKHYALEDVPWVQFFDKAVALHGVFWHRDLGHIHSHGCVNLAPLDARWLFAFTGPHLPAGWSAVYPTRSEPGTLVRVR